ncbi:hypothetical protein BGZ82_011164 [Podila clonocystis]|nr:hypothetical protein BGZ82_011164 [Podila clonocystis]
MSSAPSWKSYFTNVPRLTKTLSTAMTAMSFCGFALRFRDMAVSYRYRDEEEMPDISIDTEAGLIHLLAMVPISFDTQAYGLTCVISGFLIGFKQLVPDHSVTLWKVSLPLLFALCMMLQGFVFRSQLQLLMAIYGLFISWIYSRFFRVQDGIRGDRSESFSFASFFPGLLQTPVKHISNAFFGILVKLKICSPTGFGGSFRYDLENPQMSGMGHTFTQPGSLRAEAERRRQLALKALDMRLHVAMGNSGSGLAGSGRQSFLGSASTKATSVSLLSLSAEPLPDDDEDGVLFETDALDINGPPGRSRTSNTSDRKEAKDKE